MKLYLTCYVMGDGYITKCFDTVTKEEAVGSPTDEQDRNLFVRSNARLLLAYVGAERFGFVRQIEAKRKDENGRRCMIHFAMHGTQDEVDPIIVMASKHYREFAQAVRNMIYYEGSEFLLDWEKYGTLVDIAAREGCRVSAEPVSLLCAEPSINYFLKYCGMNWKETDIAAMLDSDIFYERSVGMRLYLYCATPSMGYILREIDSETGAIVREEKESRDAMQEELLAMLDNAGCKMALFRTGDSQCFIAKEVKADTIDRYGQRKTVYLAAEGMSDEKSVRKLAFFALTDYNRFKESLTDCVNISAGTTGWSVDGEKWQKFMKNVREMSEREPEEIYRSGKNAPYTFLIMDTSLDYFCRSTGLNVSRKDVAHIYREEQLGSFHVGICRNEELSGASVGQEMKSNGAFIKQDVKNNGEKNITEIETPKRHRKNEKQLVRDTVSDADRQEERIDLLKSRGFWIVIKVIIFAAFFGFMFLIIRYWRKGGWF